MESLSLLASLPLVYSLALLGSLLLIFGHRMGIDLGGVLLLLVAGASALLAIEDAGSINGWLSGERLPPVLLLVASVAIWWAHRRGWVTRGSGPRRGGWWLLPAVGALLLLLALTVPTDLGPAADGELAEASGRPWFLAGWDWWAANLGSDLVAYYLLPSLVLTILVLLPGLSTSRSTGETSERPAAVLFVLAAWMLWLVPATYPGGFAVLISTAAPRPISPFLGWPLVIAWCAGLPWLVGRWRRTRPAMERQLNALGRPRQVLWLVLLSAVTLPSATLYLRWLLELLG